MENLNLETYGVEEMSENQLTEINGGWDQFIRDLIYMYENYPGRVGQKLGEPLQKIEFR